PRDLLASILTSAVRGAGYGVGLYLIVVAFTMVLDLGVTRGRGIRRLVPLALLALFALFYGAFVLLRTRAAALLLLLGGGPTALLWQWTLIDLDPGIGSDGILLLNRVVMALVLIGPLTDRMLPGLGWITAG